MARIYVIDDDEQLLRMVGLMLQRGGHATTLISDPAEGFEQIQADKPDALVLDVMMPNMSGHDLTRKIRNTESLADLPILILTARSQEIDRATALESGADSYLSKPVTAKELIGKLDDLLTRKDDKPKQTVKGAIIVLYGLRGGVGRTTLAVNLAAALRRRSQQEVCLLDLSVTAGQAVWHMRMKPQSSWLELAQSGEIAWEAIQEQMMLHPSGLRVLAAPAMPQAPSLLSGENTAAILEELQLHTTFIVIDAPAVVNPSLKVSLSESDMALHIISPEVIAVQTALQVNTMLARAEVNIKYRAYLVNQTVPEPQLSTAAVEKGLNSRIAFQIGYDPNQPRALAQGVPLTLTSAQSPLPTVVHRMAEAIVKRMLKREKGGA
jgi:pilus assembly protein CpaE